MADKYIDYEETQIYGPYAAKQIRVVALKLVPKYDAALNHIADEILNATAEVAKFLGDTRQQDAARHSGSQKKEPLLSAAIDLLRRFSKHLDTHKRGEIVRSLYMPSSLTEIGESAPRVLLALSHIADSLAQKDCPVHEAKTWHKEVAAAAAALSPAIAHADSARTARRELTPSLEQARSAWMLVYQAAKDTASAVLRLTGKLHLMPEVFYDLAVPSKAKVTAPPAPGPGDGTAAAPSAKKKAAKRRKS